jgi:hypothetical protein
MEKKRYNPLHSLSSRSPVGGLTVLGEALTPLMECPNDAMCAASDVPDSRKERWSKWMRSRLPWSHPSASPSSSDLRLLLSVMGAPLAPFPVSTGELFPQLSLKIAPIVCTNYMNMSCIFNMYDFWHLLNNCIHFSLLYFFLFLTARFFSKIHNTTVHSCRGRSKVSKFNQQYICFGEG